MCVLSFAERGAARLNSVLSFLGDPLCMVRYSLDFSTRPSLRLVRVLEILTQLKVIDPLPSRQTLIRWIEKGTLEGKKTPAGYYIIYEDSLKLWIRSLQPEGFSEIR
jgi:hypothetical protein